MVAFHSTIDISGLLHHAVTQVDLDTVLLVLHYVPRVSSATLEQLIEYAAQLGYTHVVMTLTDQLDSIT
jgi:hypothetical protein